MIHITPPLAEQTLYRGLLNGNMLSELNYANGLAAFYAEKFTDRTYFEQHREIAFDKLSDLYRIVLTEDEEKELVELLEGTDIPRLIVRLYALEALYMDDFSELAQANTQRIEAVQAEIRERLQFELPNGAIDALNTTLSQTRALHKQKEEHKVIGQNDKLEKQLADIRKNWGQSETVLYKDLLPKFIIHVENKYGDREEAYDTYTKSMAEFRTKLRLTPISEPGRQQKGTYYRWFENRATVKTFFYGVCLRRWIDVLKSSQKSNNRNGWQEDIADPDDSEPGGSQPMPTPDVIDFTYPKELGETIDALDPFCRDLIRLHYFEGYSLPEIAEMLPYTDEKGNIRFYSYRTIVVKHNQCLEKLKKMV